MKILVCIKQVPQKDAPLRLNPEGTWIRDDVSWETNEPDAYALEEALRQKEKHGGEVAVITAGPGRCRSGDSSGGRPVCADGCGEHGAGSGGSD